MSETVLETATAYVPQLTARDRTGERSYPDVVFLLNRRSCTLSEAVRGRFNMSEAVPMVVIHQQRLNYREYVTQLTARDRTGERSYPDIVFLLNRRSWTLSEAVRGRFNMSEAVPMVVIHQQRLNYRKHVPQLTARDRTGERSYPDVVFLLNRRSWTLSEAVRGRFNMSEAVPMVVIHQQRLDQRKQHFFPEVASFERKITR